MKTISIHGKPYVMVKDRIMKFHEDYPNGSIETELIEMTDRFIFKAKVTPDVENPQRYFTGHAEEIIGSSQINNTSALENSETSAIGRSLGALSIGVEESFASGDEVENAIHQQGNMENKNSTTSSKATRSNEFECPKCNSGIFDNRVKDADGNFTINEKRHPAFKCKSIECKFATWETDSLAAGVMPQETALQNDEDQRHYEAAMAENKQSNEEIPF